MARGNFGELYLLQRSANVSYIVDYEPKQQQPNIDSSCLLELDNTTSFVPVYAFTNTNRVCYVYTFVTNNLHYSILLLTKKSFPKLFMNFFEDAKNYFDSAEEADAQCRFNVIWTLMQCWVEEDGNLNLFSFGNLLNMKTSQLGYDQYEPSSYFSSKTNYVKLWKSVLLNKKILIIANRTEDLAPAVFSVIGIVSPFEYKGRFMIKSTKNVDNVMITVPKDASIIGLLKDDLKYLSKNIHFDMVLRVETNRGKEKDTVIVKKKAKLLRDLMITITDRNLETDPYHELCNRQIVTDDIDDVLCPEMKAKTLEFSELREFEKTKTFQNWNRPRLFRGELRSSFLSVSPSEAIGSLQEYELPMAHEKVMDLLRLNPSDEHLCSVLRKHRRSIERKLGSNIKHSSDSSDTAY